MAECENGLRDSGCERQCRTVCFSCGMPACRPCSLVVPYYRYGRKRVCISCFEDRREDLLPHLNDEQMKRVRELGLVRA